MFPQFRRETTQPSRYEVVVEEFFNRVVSSKRFYYGSQVFLEECGWIESQIHDTRIQLFRNLPLELVFPRPSDSLTKVKPASMNLCFLLDVSYRINFSHTEVTHYMNHLYFARQESVEYSEKKSNLFFIFLASSKDVAKRTYLFESRIKHHHVQTLISGTLPTLKM